jgi:activator of HSP90 ATPase
VLEYSGKAADGTEVEGKITIPEVAHDTEEDEYVFDIENTADSNAKQPVRDLVRKKIVPQLRKKMALFSGELLATHGHDIQHTAANAPVAYSSTTITSSSSKQTTAKPAAATPTPVAKGAVVNTIKLEADYEFQTSAEQLYLCFTDARRVAAFTRATPRVFEAKEGGKFDMFTGNVQGEFVKLEKDKFIAQKWRLNTWPAGMF